MRLALRALADRDLTRIAWIQNASGEGPVSAEGLRDAEARFDRSRYDRFHLVAADEEDVAVGYALATHLSSRFDPVRYFITIGVDPGKRRKGVGSALWLGLHEELRERRAGVACVWADDATAYSTFLMARGFTEVIRAYEQVLALASAPLPTPAAEERVAAAGIVLTDLATLRDQHGDRALREAYDLHTACRLDQPTLGQVTAGPYAEWHAYNVDAPVALLDSYLVALDGDRQVAACSIRRESDDCARIGITGVLPSHRRRGIARLLKLRMHERAKRYGFRELRTSNSAPNRGMLALNEALGYVIVSSYAGYELGLVRLDVTGLRPSR